MKEKKSLFSERLRKLRKKEGCSASVASELCGINKNAFSIYESGKSEPVLSNIIAIARHYEVSIDYLAGETDDPCRKTNLS